MVTALGRPARLFERLTTSSLSHEAGPCCASHFSEATSDPACRRTIELTRIIVTVLQVKTPMRLQSGTKSESHASPRCVRSGTWKEP